MTPAGENPAYTTVTVNGDKLVVTIKQVDGLVLDKFEIEADKTAKIASASLTVEEDLTMNYFVELGKYYADGVSMKFTMNGEETIVSGQRQTDGRYKFSFTDIAPQYMGDTIKAELMYNGEVIACKEEYSVKAYVQNKLVDADDKLKRLLSDLLYYGDEAQKFVGYKTDELVSTGVEGLLDKVTATPTDNFNLTTEQAEEYPAYFKAAGVLFDNVNKLYVRVAGSLENATIKVYKDGVEVNEYELTASTFYTDGIMATDFDAVFTFELRVNGELLQTLTYSVNSYAYAMKDDAKMASLVSALYNYGASAEAYKA